MASFSLARAAAAPFRFALTTRQHCVSLQDWDRDPGSHTGTRETRKEGLVMPFRAASFTAGMEPGKDGIYLNEGENKEATH